MLIAGLEPLVRALLSEGKANVDAVCTWDGACSLLLWGQFDMRSGVVFTCRVVVVVAAAASVTPLHLAARYGHAGTVVCACASI